MTKLLAAAGMLAVLLRPESGVSIAPEGVKIAGAPVESATLVLRETDQGTLLVSSTCVEPVTRTVDVSVAESRTLALEPGVRVQKTAAGLLLSVHGNRWVRLEAPAGVVVKKASIAVKTTERGWDCGDGRMLEGARLLVRVQQDDPDKNLEQMKEAARRLEEAIKRGKKPPDIIEPPPDTTPQRRVRRRRVFAGDDPTLGGEGADSSILRRVREASPIGF